MPSASEPDLPSQLAVAALVSVAVLAPWAFGAVGETSSLIVILVGLLSAAAALALGAARGGLQLPAVSLWPCAGFVLLGLVQLVPLPSAFHRLLAPGSFAVWHPSEPPAAAILGAAARPLSLDPSTTLRAVALLSGWLLCAALAAPALGRARTAVRAIGVVAACGFALSAYAIVARARFGALLYGSIPVPTVSPFGPFVSKNHFAGWAVMAALLAVGLALGLAAQARARHGAAWSTSRRAGAVVLTLLSALALALAVVVSLSRGGSLALVLGGTLLLTLTLGGRAWRGRPLARVSSLLLAAVLVAAVFWLAPRAAHERLHSLAGASFRLDTWRDSLGLAAASPLLGCGLGAFHDAYPRFKTGHGSLRVEHAESDYIETLAEMGLVGLALALLAVVLLFRAVLRRGGEPGRDRLTRALGHAAVAALAALAAHSALDFNLRIPSNAVLAALAVAVAAAASGTRQRPLRPAIALSLALALASLAVALLRLPDRPWLAAREAVRLAAASSAAPARALRLARAEAALVHLLRLRPAHAESWLMLAGVRRARGDWASAAALARRAVWLDPERPELRQAAVRLLSPSRLDPTRPKGLASAGAK